MIRKITADGTIIHGNKQIEALVCQGSALDHDRVAQAVTAYPLDIEGWPPLIVHKRLLDSYRDNYGSGNVPAKVRNRWAVSDALTGLAVENGGCYEPSRTVIYRAQERLERIGLNRYLEVREDAFRMGQDPVTGVIVSNGERVNQDVLHDYWTSGVNSSWMMALETHKKECTDANCKAYSHDRWRDTAETTPDDTHLIGSWRYNSMAEDLQFEVDKERGDFAAVYHQNTIQVVWSKELIRVKSWCSPCYPNQADLDSGNAGPVGGILAYDLPQEFYNERPN